MFETIRWLELGSLSALPTIPESYARNLVSYIIQVSQTLSHAHNNDCVHGKFSLSKVLVQMMKPDDFQFEYHIFDFQPF